MADGWHYAEGEEVKRAISFDEIRIALSKAPDPHKVLVWKPGFNDWRFAGDIEELAGLFPKPPPLPTARPPKFKASSDPEAPAQAKPRKRAIPKWATTSLFGLAIGLSYAAVKYGVDWVKNEEIGLKYQVRTEFVASFVDNCIKTQSADPENRAIQQSVIATYCNCTANATADRVSNNQMKSLSTLPPAEAVKTIQPTIEAAAGPCLDGVGQAVKYR
jgi:hypothetical protein